jgi:hypothetical protein
MSETTTASKSGGPAISLLIITVVAATIFLQARWNRSIDWSKPNIALPVYRGDDGAERPLKYAQADLQAFADELRAAISGNLPKPKLKLRLGPGTQYALSTELMELFDGALSVQVRAVRYKDQTPAKEWKKEFASAEDFRSGSAALGATVAGDLSAMMSP